VEVGSAGPLVFGRQVAELRVLTLK
jgi:hypothetical protein